MRTGLTVLAPGQRITCLGLFVLSTLLAPVQAQTVDAELRPGDRFTGGISDAADVDVLVIEALHETRVKVIVKAVKKSSLRPRVQIVDSIGVIVIEQAAAKGKLKLVATLPATDTYRIRISGEGGTTGAYKATYKEKIAKAARKIVGLGEVPGGAVFAVTFDGLAGFQLKAKLQRKPKKSAAVPGQPTLLRPGGGALTVDPKSLVVNKKSDKFRLKKVVLDAAGTWTFASTNVGDLGTLSAKLSIRRPKHKKLKISEAPTPEPLPSEPTLYPARHFFAGLHPSDLGLADFDGDGVADLAVTFDSGVSILRGDGKGAFTAALELQLPGDQRSLGVGDLNGDGHADLVVGTQNSTAAGVVLMGNGDGTFVPAIPFQASVVVDDIVIGDLDQDGDADAVLIDELGQRVSVLRGNGTGTFSPDLAVLVGVLPSSAAIGDVDEDGIPDLVVTNGGDNDVSILLGNGNGTFTSPVDFSTGVQPTFVALADLDADGHLDLAVTNGGSDSVSVLLGQGTGSFGLAASLDAGAEPRGVTAVDLDGDGVLDLAVVNGGSNDVSVLLGLGGGSFEAPVAVSSLHDPFGIQSADLDGDGTPDLVVVDRGSFDGFPHGDVIVLLGTGDGTFPDAAIIDVGEQPGDVAVADLDGDGVLDLVSTGSLSVAIHMGTGLGDFGPLTSIAMGDLSFPRVPAAADLDGDGVLDLAIPVRNALAVLMGNGDGSFAPMMTFPAGEDTEGMAIADMNGDGILDVALATLSAEFIPMPGEVLLLFGNGDGTFAAATSVPAGIFPIAVALADLDGDGAPDLVVANEGDDRAVVPGDVRILLNNGDGSFGPPSVLEIGVHPTALAVGDLNGDGRADLVVQSVVSLFLHQVFVRPGNGDGTFGAETTVPAVGGEIHIVDVDGDGVPDLVLPSGEHATVVRGVGDGTFAPPTLYSAHGTGRGGTGDFDGDGRVDLVFADGDLFGTSLFILFQQP